MKKLQKLLIIVLFSFAFLANQNVTAYYAPLPVSSSSNNLIPVEYSFGTEYSGQLDNQYIGTGETFAKSFLITLSERKHIYIIVQAALRNYSVSVYDRNGNYASNDSNSHKTRNDLKTLYTTEHSVDLSAGTYQIIVRNPNPYGDSTHRFNFIAFSENIISLDSPTITKVNSPQWGSVNVSISPLNNALVYETQFASDINFSDQTTVSGADTDVTISGLNNRTNYVRTRAYATYSDGVTVFSGWSLVKSITFLKLSNNLEVKGKTATIKYTDLENKNLTLAVKKVISFKHKGRGNKTFAKVSGNKNITINKKSGKVTVKKGLKSGKYKVKVKVKAGGNSKYKASNWKSLTFTIVVK